MANEKVIPFEQKAEPTAEAKEAMGVSDNATTINSVDEMEHIVTN